MRKSLRQIIVILFLLFSATLFSQKYTLRGTVKDAQNGETLPVAAITLDGPNKQSTATDFDGNFTISNLDSGTYSIKIIYVGYQPLVQTLSITNDVSEEFLLSTDAQVLDEVVIDVDVNDENVESTTMGKVELKVEEIQKMPALFGEVDILKSIQMLPGVQSGGEGTSGLYVRGGGPDQNLILLDDATVYNSGHLFGFFSIFNADAIDDVNLYKGSIPANYGGRLSSVLTFDTKRGNMDSLSGSAGIGLISSRLSLEGPIKKGKSSFIVSYRRTYIDAVSSIFLRNREEGPDRIPYFFYDFNSKLHFVLDSNNILDWSVYVGADDLSIALLDGRVDASIRWENKTSSLSWKHFYSDSLFLKTSFNISDYNFEGSTRFDNISANIFSGNREYNLRSAIVNKKSSKHSLIYGLDYTFYTFTPRDYDVADAENENQGFNTATTNLTKYVSKPSVFFNDEWIVNKKWKLDLGLRYTLFQQLGPYEYIYFDSNGNRDTTSYGILENVVSFSGLEPRIGARYKIDSSSSVKGAIMYNSQYNHLVSLSGNTMPFDVWVPSSLLLKPQRGLQLSLGYFKNFAQNKYEVSTEIYYRYMANQADYREDYYFELTGEIEEALTSGRGDAYGAEFFLQKKKGKLHGWIGYTLAWSTRKFADINDGKRYYARYDRRHDLSIVAIYDLNKKWTFAANFIYGTGQNSTLQLSRFFIEGQVVGVNGPRNHFRMPAYHRADISITYRPQKWKKVNGEWVFSIYNVYNRANPYLIFFDVHGDPVEDELRLKANQLHIFPILPSIACNIRF